MQMIVVEWIDEGTPSILLVLLLRVIFIPSFLLFSQTFPDTWLLSAMDTTQIFCIYYALAFHPTPFQSLPLHFGVVSPKCKPSHISPLTKIFEGSLFFHISQNVMEGTSQYDPKLKVLQSNVTHQDTLGHFLTMPNHSQLNILSQALSQPHASEQVITSACKVPSPFFGSRLPSQLLPLFWRVYW